jgi:hypothetical protein
VICHPERSAAKSKDLRSHWYQETSYESPPLGPGRDDNSSWSGHQLLRRKHELRRPEAFDLNDDMVMAALRLRIRRRMPETVVDIADRESIQRNATPLSAGRQTLAAATRELKEETLPSSRPCAQRVRAHLTLIALVASADALLLLNRFRKNFNRCAVRKVPDHPALDASLGEA